MKSAFDFQPTNPFSASQIAPNQVVYRFSHGATAISPHSVDSHLEALLAKLRETRRGVIIGPHGTGKSTLLHTFLPKLQRSYPTVAFHALTNDPSFTLAKRWAERMRSGKRVREALSELPKDGLLIIDGWEQLTAASRWRITKSASGKKVTLLATSHRFIPGWTVIHETKPTPKLIRSLAGDLLEDSPHEIRKLVDTNLKSRPLSPTTNVRDLWFEMYDMVEDAHSHELKYNS